MRSLIVVALAACFMGCQHVRDTLGCYAHTDLRLGFVEQFGNNSGGGLSGNTETISNHPAHGGSSTSSFSLDQSNQYANETFLMDVTVRLAPGSCN